jgi:hypothetical protein
LFPDGLLPQISTPEVQISAANDEQVHAHHKISNTKTCHKRLEE